MGSLCSSCFKGDSSEILTPDIVRSNQFHVIKVPYFYNLQNVLIDRT